jgi:hypothetical protein
MNIMYAGEMKRLTLILVALAIAIIIVIPIGLWFTFFQQPIKAKPDELLLTSEDLLGWYQFDRSPSEGYYSGVGMNGPEESVFMSLHNDSVEVGYNLSIGIFCYSSSRHAHDQFKMYWVIPDPSSPVLGDEGGRSNGTTTLVSDNGEFLIGESVYFTNREANVLVRMQFETAGTEVNPLDPNGTYFEPWMDEISIQQMAKVDSFNIHL